jgi:chitinase
MYEYLDYVHVMCYDYHGKWDRKTGHNAPLFSGPDDLSLGVADTVDHLLKRGAEPEKTVLGVPLYGRAYLLDDPGDARLGAPSGRSRRARPRGHVP